MNSVISVNSVVNTVPPVVRLRSSPTPRRAALTAAVSDLEAFSLACYPHTPLRGYQLAIGLRIVAAVLRGAGGQFALLFARQAGKDELLAQVQAYLLLRAQGRGGGTVLAAPTLRPQGLISLRRLEARLRTPLHRPARRRDVGLLQVGQATAAFLSAEPTAQARGETASLLLIGNEAQDIAPARWDAVFAPMTASTNAPHVVAGTAWATDGLLARQVAWLEEGAPERVCRVAWEEVAAEVPAYGAHVRARMAQLGADHPFIRTEYCLEPLATEDGLLPARRRARMQGVHPRAHTPVPGTEYALTLDVGGAADCGLQTADCGLDGVDEHRVDHQQRSRPGAQHSLIRNPQSAIRNDATALTVFAVDREPVGDPLIGLPRYRVVDRQVWVGADQPALYAALRDLAAHWAARWLVVDATGLGAGLAQFLQRACAPRTTVLPFVFSAQSKSALGWGWLGTIESGRYKDYAPDGAADTGLFWAQAAACRMAVAPGPGRLLQWSVPAARGHDDLLVSAALVAHLDTAVAWRGRSASGRSYE